MGDRAPEGNGSSDRVDAVGNGSEGTYSVKCSELLGLGWLMAHGENVQDASYPEYQPDHRLRDYVEHVCIRSDWPEGEAPEGVPESRPGVERSVGIGPGRFDVKIDGLSVEDWMYQNSPESRKWIERDRRKREQKQSG